MVLRKSQNQIATKLQESLLDPDASQIYGDAIEEQMRQSLMHPEKAENLKGEEHKSGKFDELVYRKNLEINFVKNKNLMGKIIDKNVEITSRDQGNKTGEYHFKLNKPQNLDRAIRDFEGIVEMREPNHAIAHYCLAKAYRYKGNDQLAEKNMNKVFDILANPVNRKWLEYFNELLPKNEMNELKHLMNKNKMQEQKTA